MTDRPDQHSDQPQPQHQHTTISEILVDLPAPVRASPDGHLPDASVTDLDPTSDPRHDRPFEDDDPSDDTSPIRISARSSRHKQNSVMDTTLIGSRIGSWQCSGHRSLDLSIEFSVSVQSTDQLGGPPHSDYPRPRVSGPWILDQNSTGSDDRIRIFFLWFNAQEPPIITDHPAVTQLITQSRTGSQGGTTQIQLP